MILDSKVNTMAVDLRAIMAVEDEVMAKYHVSYGDVRQAIGGYKGEQARDEIVYRLCTELKVRFSLIRNLYNISLSKIMDILGVDNKLNTEQYLDLKIDEHIQLSTDYNLDE